jgi:hypothetical protein
MKWNNAQIKSFASAVRHQWGPGWDFLGKHQQECAVAGMIVRAIMMQMNPEVDGLKDFIRKIMQEAGVWEIEA